MPLLSRPRDAAADRRFESRRQGTGASDCKSRRVRRVIGPTRATLDSGMHQLLSDVSVVDLSTEPAGAYCAKVFADLGADVVKVEPRSGDPLRRHPERFVHLNTNKRSVVFDSAEVDELVAL